MVRKARPFCYRFFVWCPPLEIHASSRTVTAVTRLSRQSLEVSHLIWRILLHQKIGAPLHALRNVRQGESRGAVLPRENGFRWKQEEGPLGGFPFCKAIACLLLARLWGLCRKRRKGWIGPMCPGIVTRWGRVDHEPGWRRLSFSWSEQEINEFSVKGSRVYSGLRRARLL